jgi:hypothetical protein
MTSVRLLWPGEVAIALKQAGCDKIAAAETTFEVWITNYGFAFTVPTIGDDRLCPQTVLHNILSEIEAKRRQS